MFKPKLKAIILLSISLLLFSIIILKLLLVLRTKDSLYNFPIDLSATIKIYNFEYTLPFYKENYGIYLRLKKNNDISPELYNVKKIKWKLYIDIWNYNNRIFSSEVNRNNLLGAGYGTDDVDFLLVKYIHQFWGRSKYKLQVKILESEGLLTSTAPEIIISYQPKCGLEAFSWFFSIMLLFGLSIILFIRGIRNFRVRVDVHNT